MDCYLHLAPGANVVSCEAARSQGGEANPAVVTCGTSTCALNSDFGDIDNAIGACSDSHVVNGNVCDGRCQPYSAQIHVAVKQPVREFVNRLFGCDLQ